jgi:16S rRNA (guanine527-N7)-methyltransferase
MTESSVELLAETAAAWGLPLSEPQLAAFASYAAELASWNERVNLTAIIRPDEIYLRHFLDSLSCALHWGDQPQSLIDIGSGAGFPGLPLKILRPALRLTLLESVAKKAAFLEHMVGLLGLEGVTVRAMRAEGAGRDPAHRGRYDVATARAVAELRVLAEYGLPLLRVGGRLLAPKGAAAREEVQAAAPALAALGGELVGVQPVALPGFDDRQIVVIRKSAPTAERFPRPAGVPARRPL